MSNLKWKTVSPYVFIRLGLMVIQAKLLSFKPALMAKKRNSEKKSHNVLQLVSLESNIIY